MHHRGTTLKSALLLAVLLAFTQQSARAGSWMADVAAAQKESQRLNKPLLMHFYADWCGPCRQMEGETLSSPEVLRTLGRDFVGVKVNTDRYEGLTKQFNVKSLPSDVIVAPDGRVLAHTVGFQGKGDYLGRLAHIDSRFKSQEKTKLANTGNEGANSVGTEPLRPVHEPRSRPNETTSRDSDARFIGLNGYSPIALFKRREWVKGSREHSTSHNGVVYLFSHPDELAEFESNPGKFAPRLIGCDPVVFIETERAIPGSTRFGAYFEGDLFLFVSSATRDQFKQEPEKYVKKLTTVTVDQIEFRRGT